MEAPQDHEEPCTSQLRRLLKAHSRIHRPRTPDSDEDYYHPAHGWGDFRIRQAKEAFRLLMGNDLTESFKEDDEANAYAKKGVALFFVESTPPPVREEAACQFLYCDEKIAAGGYRVALYPRLLCGSRRRTGGAGKTYLNVLRVALTSSIDYYHVECFEQLVDFWDSQYYQRLLPTLDGFWRLRGLSDTLNDYYLDIGAGILVSEWKMAMVRLMDKRDGVTADRSSFPFPVSGDEHAWSVERFVKHYLPLKFTDVEDLEKPHTLSTMLYVWKHDRVSCYSQDRTTADITVPGTCLRRRAH